MSTGHREEIDSYIKDRVDDQFAYFDSNAMKNQKAYRRLKLTAITCNVLTTMTIALAFAWPQNHNALMILALILSTIVLATYQLEEFQNYGAKWEKFRLVAERLRSEKFMFINKVGPYYSNDYEKNKGQLVETVEGIIRNTDVVYFSLMVAPGERIDKRLQQSQD